MHRIVDFAFSLLKQVEEKCSGYFTACDMTVKSRTVSKVLCVETVKNYDANCYIPVSVRRDTTATMIRPV